MKTKIAIFFAIISVISSLGFAGCKKKGSITISDEWVGETIPGSRVSACYLSILNSTGEDDVLQQAEAENFEIVEFHNLIESNGVMKMNALDYVDVKNGETTRFSPGGMHIMLINNKKPLKAGEFETLTLHFKNAGSIIKKIPVKNIQEQVN